MFQETEKTGEGVSWDEFIRHSKTLAGTDIFVNC